MTKTQKSIPTADPARNQAVADIVQSVVVEEMLHMTLASMAAFNSASPKRTANP